MLFRSQIICSLHGPVLKENLGYYLDLYDTWSAYRPETEGVLIAYNSIYGNTRKAVDLLAEKLGEKGADVVAQDLARCDMAEAVADAFRYSKLVLATPTYNGDVFPPMKAFLNHLLERGYKSRTVGMMENGSWAPMANKVMHTMLEKSKDIVFTENNVSIASALNEASTAQVEALAEELCKA